MKSWFWRTNYHGKWVCNHSVQERCIYILLPWDLGNKCVALGITKHAGNSMTHSQLRYHLSAVKFCFQRHNTSLVKSLYLHQSCRKACAQCRDLYLELVAGVAQSFAMDLLIKVNNLYHYIKANIKINYPSQEKLGSIWCN